MAAKILSGLAAIYLTLGLCACVTPSGGADAALVEFEASSIADEETFRQWFAYFYAHQRVDLVPDAVRYMATHDYLVDHPDISSMFLARVFAKYPEQLNGWLVGWRPLEQASWGVILVSLHFSGSPEANRLMHANLQRTTASERRRILDLEASGRGTGDPLDISVDDPRQINLLWSAYSATGDKRYVEKVVDYLSLYEPSGETLDAEIGQAALMTLASNSLQHPGVAEVCLDERRDHPDADIRTLLTAMLTAVARYIQEEEQNSLPAH